MGTVALATNKYSFVVSEESENDIRVFTDRLKFAMNGDTVRVRLRGERDGRPVGDVDVGYGPKAMQLLKQGMAPADIIKTLVTKHLELSDSEIPDVSFFAEGAFNNLYAVNCTTAPLDQSSASR